MAGLPYHAAPAYVNRLLTAGWKVAICDQLEAPVAGKLVRRGLTRILTPGTALEDSQLDSRRGITSPHFLGISTAGMPRGSMFLRRTSDSPPTRTRSVSCLCYIRSVHAK